MSLTSQQLLDSAIAHINMQLLPESIEKLGDYIAQLQRDLASQAELGDFKPSIIDIACVEKIAAEFEDGGQWFMRHGDQDSPAEISQLSKIEKKIAQMRLENNMRDGITRKSALDFVVTMCIAKFLQQHHAIQFADIHTSENQRAQIPATALAKVLGVKCNTVQNLNCVNYLSEAQLMKNGISSEQFRSCLNDGAMPWEKQKVETACGKGSFDQLTENTQQYFQTMPRDKLTVCMTHTQQHVIAALFYNILNDASTLRLDSFGFLVVSDRVRYVQQHGFIRYKKPNTDLLVDVGVFAAEANNHVGSDHRFTY